VKQLYQLENIDLLELYARSCQGVSCGEYDDTDILKEILHRMKKVNTVYVPTEDGPCFNCDH
jgi:hypothetical protein